MKYKKKKETVDFSVIADAICDFFEVEDKIELFRKTRKREVIYQRQWFHYFARILNPEHTVSSTSIANYYSDVTGHSYNHATVLHSVSKIKDFLDVSKHDRDVKNDILIIINHKLSLMKQPNIVDMKLQVTNQWKQALFYLIYWSSFSLADVINDSMFYKFQSRLSEIEQEHGVICTRTRKEFTNRFGRKSNHTVYLCTDKQKALELFEKHN